MPVVEKVEREVEVRLKAQINHWDRRAEELKAREREGKKTRLPSGRAAERAEGLAGRLQRRRELLAKERQISALPPVVRGGALIIPGDLLRGLKEENGAGGVAPANDPDVARREEIERLAMEAVTRAEKDLGREPRDVSAQRGIGHDIESRDPASGSLYFIEVKGKWEEKDDLVLTKNEILCSRNEPERVRLALVVVGEGGDEAPRYLKGYPFGEPDFAETGRAFSLRKLLEMSGEPV